MRRTIDPANPPRKEKISVAEIRERVARRFQTMSDDDLMRLVDDTGVSLVALLGSDQYELRLLPDGDYELIDYSPPKTGS